jgi:hypothetical protein
VSGSDHETLIGTDVSAPARLAALEAHQKQRFTERGAECRLTHVKGYTGPICSCRPLTCRAADGHPEASA